MSGLSVFVTPQKTALAPKPSPFIKPSALAPRPSPVVKAEALTPTPLPVVKESSVLQESKARHRLDKEKPFLEQEAKTYVHLIGTGGTIAGESDSEGGYRGGKTFMRDIWNGRGSYIKDFVVEKIAPGGRSVEVDDPIITAGEDMTDQDRVVVLKEIQKSLGDDECEGIVVTHGTDTIAQTTQMTHEFFAGNLRKPVVFTGSMIPGDRPDSEGPQNLTDAILLARELGKIGSPGVYLTANGKIFSGADVVKTDAHKKDAFSASARPELVGKIEHPSLESAPAVGLTPPLQKGTVKVDPRLYENVIQETEIEFAPEDYRRTIEKKDMPKVSIISASDGRVKEKLEESLKKGDWVVFDGYGDANIPDDVQEKILQIRRDIAKDPKSPEPIIVRSSNALGSGVSNAQIKDRDLRTVRSASYSPERSALLLRMMIALFSKYDVASKVRPRDLQRCFDKHSSFLEAKKLTGEIIARKEEAARAGYRTT